MEMRREGNRPEDTPAYQILKRHNLLTSSYRLDSPDEIDAVAANSNPWAVAFWNICCCPLALLGCFKTHAVPAGHVTPVEDGRGGFIFHGKGNHLICDPFYKVHTPKPFGVNTIVHGDRSLLVVQQGQIGFALNKGQPVLLPPGLHQWQDPTLVYRDAFDLNNNVIRMGPLTLVTVDEGYSCVTEDNGKQVILPGGDTYLLPHRNHKFQKYISTKIQSTNMKQIRATSADNVLMAVDATVIWRITDVDVAAKNSAETITSSGADELGDVGDIAKLTNDVLKQAEASLAAFIGAVNYSDTFNVAAAIKAPVLDAVPLASPAQPDEDSSVSLEMSKQPSASPLFDLVRMNSCVAHANDITKTYGVSIISINVVGAVPADTTLQSSLAQGAVAAAEAQKYEIVAHGKAAAALVEARGVAESNIIRAKGEAEADKIRATGTLDAARLIESSPTAIRFSMVEKTGNAIADKTSIFFGADAANLDKMLAPAVVAAATNRVTSRPSS
ncbi:hypothetical protein CYMTET_42730 [Cymbomonas tetramitiformis]|uniref:Band 7 domain-containing protein n=1 Tax=Cymbomonas tetramitiformis TaxID=36881 RepID=A0AAE0F183_9CHLO|nr:hypothetical protein CYMTET_46905 [Cymbomonas tetramitiformis]KAK3247779.1 hypothetical protein CYMTET_42730 [Cymbomonas tetramitiformis]|eukprot:gene6222-7455_t